MKKTKKTVRISALAMLVLAAAMAGVWGCNAEPEQGSQPQLEPPQSKIQIEATTAPSQLTVEWNVVNGAEVYEVYLDGGFYGQQGRFGKRN
jgi:hypothetical protein